MKPLRLAGIEPARDALPAAHAAARAPVEHCVTCRELASFLADYLSGELPPATARAFEEHLAVCPNCVRYLEQFRATIDVARTAVTQYETKVSQDFPDDLRRAILQARYSTRNAERGTRN